jgi:hypothetical protein
MSWKKTKAKLQELRCDLAAQKNYTVSVEQQRDRLWDQNEQLKMGLEKIAGLCFAVLEDGVEFKEVDIDGVKVVLATAKGVEDAAGK